MQPCDDVFRVKLLKGGLLVEITSLNTHITEDHRQAGTVCYNRESQYGLEMQHKTCPGSVSYFFPQIINKYQLLPPFPMSPRSALHH